MPVARTIPSPAATDLVTFTIKIDGEEVPRDIHVEQVLVQKAVNKIPFAKVKIADGNPAEETFTISDGAYFIPGKAIEILLGYHSEETTIFKGMIVAISNAIRSRGSYLLVECKDVVVKMTVGKHSKHYLEQSDSDIAEEIISKYSGITAEVESTSTVLENLVQFDLSDWDFIVSRMESMGRICLVNDGVFTIKKPALDEEPKLDVLYGATILEYSAAIDSRHQFQGVQSLVWDFSNQEIVEADAQEPAWQEGGNIANTDLAQTIGLENFKLKHAGKLSTAEMQEWADALLVKSRLSKVKGHVKYQGNADIKPGDFIGLNGVGQRFSGKAIVTAVTHECTDGLWTTDVQFGLSPQWYAETTERKDQVAQMGQMHGIQGLQVGVVVNNEDPLAENRVQVRLPIVHPGEDGIWARVATLDAGNNRGSFFRPEIDDEVIVGFISNDPSHAVVLGMVHSSAKPAPIEPSNDNHEKGFVSREQMKLLFNDDDKSIIIETPAGNKITISEKDSMIKVEDQNGNQVSMEQAGVTIESATALTLKAGADLTIEAVNITVSPSASFALSAGGAEMKAGSGSASFSAPTVKIEGSGMTEIKGGLVKIN